MPYVSFRICSAALVIALLSSCSKPVPLASYQLQYVGLWVASDRHLSIFANGEYEYREKLGFGLHNRSSGNASIEGDQLKGFFSSYTINRPPYPADGSSWEMQVDGVTYRRTGDPVFYGRSKNWPEGVE